MSTLSINIKGTRDPITIENRSSKNRTAQSDLQVLTHYLRESDSYVLGHAAFTK